MAYVQANALFPQQTLQYWMPPAPVQQGIDLGAVLLTPGTVALVAYAAGAFDTPAERRCGTCGRAGHDTRTCSQNPAKRVKLRIVKTGWCSCCDRKFQRTEAQHYAGPADGSKGREMCGTCHLVWVAVGIGRTWARTHATAAYNFRLSNHSSSIKRSSTCSMRGSLGPKHRARRGNFTA